MGSGRFHKNSDIVQGHLVAEWGLISGEPFGVRRSVAGTVLVWGRSWFGRIPGNGGKGLRTARRETCYRLMGARGPLVCRPAPKIEPWG